MKAVVFVTCFAVLLPILVSPCSGWESRDLRSEDRHTSEGSEIRLISPIGAAVRSIIPGWGQIYTRSKLEGILVFLSVGSLGAGAAQANVTYRDIYDNEYTPAALSGSDQADIYFDRANQYYKLSRFLLYTAAFIWGYSILDAYVDAHIYNARQQVHMLEIDDESLQELKVGTETREVAVPEKGYLYSYVHSRIGIKR